MQGTLFDIEDLTADDGPGTRSVFFFKGCNLKCSWCSNPESQASEPELLFAKSLCHKSGVCAQQCSLGAISWQSGDYPVFDRKICSRCQDKKCVEACQSEAIKIKGQNYSVVDLVNHARRNFDFYYHSGGGITLSGGEPLKQPGLVRTFLKNCQPRICDTVLCRSSQSRISVGIETCGLFHWKAVEDFISQFDFIYYDIKLMDDELHKKYTGVSNKTILDNLEKTVKRVGANKIIISLPMIPTVNINDQHIDAVIELCKYLKILKVRLLPYHHLGIEKYSMLGREYPLPKELQLNPSDEKLLIKFRRKFTVNHIHCAIDGFVSANLNHLLDQEEEKHSESRKNFTVPTML